MDPSDKNTAASGGQNLNQYGGLPQGQAQPPGIDYASPAPQSVDGVFPSQQQQASFAPPPSYQPQQPAAAYPPAAVPQVVEAGKPAAAPKGNPNSTQNMLQIAEVRDGLAIMNDGSFRSVVMVKSINFDLMSPAEREGVEFGFQSFLNSLYFPIQIFVRSKRVDIGPYIQKLDKIRSEHDNMLLALLMDDYIDYIDRISQQTNIMDKSFYVVIPYFPKVEKQHALSSSKGLLDGIFGMFSNNTTHVVINESDLQAAKTELRNRVQAVLSGLLECGVQGLPLDTQELIELYYDTYNPDTAPHQQLKNFDDLKAPVITKGEGQAPQPNLEKELG